MVRVVYITDFFFIVLNLMAFILVILIHIPAPIVMMQPFNQLIDFFHHPTIGDQIRISLNIPPSSSFPICGKTVILVTSIVAYPNELIFGHFCVHIMVFLLYNQALPSPHLDVSAKLPINFVQVHYFLHVIFTLPFIQLVIS